MSEPPLPEQFDDDDRAFLAAVRQALKRLADTHPVVPFTARPDQLYEHLMADADWTFVPDPDPLIGPLPGHLYFQHRRHAVDSEYADEYIVSIPAGLAVTDDDRRACLETAYVINALALGLPPIASDETFERLTVIAALSAATMDEIPEMAAVFAVAMGRAPSPLLIPPE
ncbi:hypothetical protein [Bailinhaonella thermotolerans]|uniref:Uncharacterized protein n=1 Tax=Bailinhaonella thermotolerans TaxID=1070861 RepID=A0A3A4A051_9ACTN|nr:hypothetical protein [Bailinhaonella thermotolerans]RJL21098.1 hypothetical protein D5H75_38455 [Bailinhaonella thermotolerans]